MATNPIYVETEEEIPELVERLRRYHGEDTMLVLPMRSRIGQSRFNFQLLRNYSARLGKRVTVVCDDPAVQKMASESGFPVFGGVGPEGQGIPSEAAPAPPIKARTVPRSKSTSQGFKVTGSIEVPLAPSTGQVVYSNDLKSSAFTNSPGLVFKYGQRLMNSNGIEFAQTSPDTVVPWNGGQKTVNVIAVTPGSVGNVGDHTITRIEDCCGPFDPNRIHVTNPQATGGGTDPSSTPQMTVSDFDAARAQLEQSLHQTIAQELGAATQQGEKLSETVIFGPPQFSTDHQPQDKVPSFTGTMTVSGEGDYYVDAEVIQAFKTYLAQRVPNNQQLLTESPIQVQYRLLSAAKGGYLVFVGSASAYVAPKLDEAKIRAQIVGRPVQQARFYLSTLPIRSVAIKESPLALPLMPLLDRRIELHYVVESNAPSAEAAAQGTPSPSPSPSH